MNLNLDEAYDRASCLDEVLFHLRNVVALLSTTKCDASEEIDTLSYIIFNAEAEKHEYETVISKIENDDYDQANGGYIRGLL